MYHYELNGLGRSFRRFNPVAATKAAISNVIKPVLKAAPKIIAKPQTALTLTRNKIIKPVVGSAILITKRTVINPTRAAMTTASPKALLTAGRQGGIAAVLGTAVSSLQSPKSSAAEGQQVQTSIMDGPLVTIYATDGSEGQIPNNYLNANGTYTDETTGMVWSTKNPNIRDLNAFVNSWNSNVNRPTYPVNAQIKLTSAPVAAASEDRSKSSIVPMNETTGTGVPIVAEQKNEALKISFLQRFAELMRDPLDKR